MRTHLPSADLLALRESWRGAGRRLVLTNGVFDLLHSGHAAYLAQARALGDLLLVALNSDSSTRAIKGPLRPIVPEDDRAALVAALRCVDYVTLFDEPTAEALVSLLKPDMYVKGGDYDGARDEAFYARLPEARIVGSYGGQVVLLPFAEGHSSSGLIARIVERYRDG